MTEIDLYERAMRTTAACWAVFAWATSGAEVHHLPHASVAVFPGEPERSIYNNAILARELDSQERISALDGIEALYGAAGVDRFAAWVHESDRAMRDELRRRGYAVDSATRAMGMRVDALSHARFEIDLAEPDWTEHLRLIGVPPALLGSLDPAVLHLLVARHEGEAAATAFGFDHDGDCGIYNVATLEHARRRGLATALTATIVCAAAARGCNTATLQSTPIAERIYAAVGFRDLGRIVEYTRSIR